MREASFLIYNLHLEWDGRGHRDKTLQRMVMQEEGEE